MFIRNATKPTQGTLTTELWEAKKEAWFAKQERACIVINNRLSYNSCKAVKGLTTITVVKGLTTITKIIAKVETPFQPSGSAVFTAFNYKYNKFSLFNCNNIMDFAEKLRKAKNKLLELDTFYKIGKFYFIYKFLSSFGFSFNIFYVIFSQTHSLLAIKATDKIVSVVAVTFDKIFMAAKKEE